jgi:hypothetical protein
MKVAVRVGKMAAMAMMALPVAAMAQYTGTSRPDQTPILNTPEVQAPVQSLAPQPALKPSPLVPMDASPVEAPVVPAQRTEPMLDEKIPAAPDIDAGVVTRIPGPSNQLPVGTLIKVRLDENISTESTPNGMVFTAKLVEGVERDGRILLPAGSTLSGFVTDVHGGKRMSGPASIHLKTSTVTLPDGMKYQVRGQVIDTDIFKVVRVDREGTIYQRDHVGKTAGIATLTTGSGAVAGAMIGGVPGAVVGGVVGAGVSTVVWLRQNRQAELPAETKIVFSLTQPLTVGVE